MRDTKKPRITKLKNQKKTGFTQVSWIPDFTLFNCDKYSMDLLQVMYKHAYD